MATLGTRRPKEYQPQLPEPLSCSSGCAEAQGLHFRAGGAWVLKRQEEQSATSKFSMCLSVPLLRPCYLRAPLGTRLPPFLHQCQLQVFTITPSRSPETLPDPS